MGIVSGGGGGTFNGGTITGALNVAPSAVGADFIPLGVAPAVSDAGKFGAGMIKVTGPSDFSTSVGDRFFSAHAHNGTELFSVEDNGQLNFRSGDGDAVILFQGETSTNNWTFDTLDGTAFVVGNVLKFLVNGQGVVTCGGLSVTGNSAIGNDAADTVAFYGHAGTAQQTVTGAKLPSDVVLASLLSALAAMGLIVDSST